MIRNFRFSKLEKTEIIKEFDGRIIIGEGINTFILEGIALPRVDEQGFIIPGEYVLGEFDLFQNDADLVIAKTGSDLSKENSAQIIIKNFPFYSGGFGIFLNRFPTNELLPAKEFEDRELFSQTVFATSDVRQRFFAPAKIHTNGETTNYAVKIFDSRGLSLGTQLLTNLHLIENDANSNSSASITSYATENDLIARRLQNGRVALIYEVREETHGVKNTLLSYTSFAFLALVDENGLVISNQKIFEQKDDGKNEIITLEPAAIITDESQKNFAYFKKSDGSVFFGQEFDLDGKIIGKKFEKDSIKKITNDGLGSSIAGLSQGYKIEADIPNGFKIFAPFFKNSKNKNLVKNYYLQDRKITLPNDKKAIISFAQELETLAKITSNPDSVLLISGLDFSPSSRIDLRDFKLSLEEILKNSFAASPRKYSIFDLLDHKFNAKNNSSENKEEAAQTEDTIIFSAARDFAVLELPENQQIIFLNFSLEIFHEIAANLLILNDDNPLQNQQSLQ